jgi:hypothetical protein
VYDPYRGLSKTERELSSHTFKWKRSRGERNDSLPLLLSESNSDFALFHLFASAMQSPRMADNWMLMGLGTSGDVVEPTNAMSG